MSQNKFVAAELQLLLRKNKLTKKKKTKHTTTKKLTNHQFGGLLQLVDSSFPKHCSSHILQILLLIKREQTGEKKKDMITQTYMELLNAAYMVKPSNNFNTYTVSPIQTSSFWLKKAFFPT